MGDELATMGGAYNQQDTKCLTMNNDHAPTTKWEGPMTTIPKFPKEGVGV